MIGLFISYRRGDGAHAAQRLRAFLRDKFGADAVFIDRDIPPGDDWAQVLEQRLKDASDVIVLVGDEFLLELRRRGTGDRAQDTDWLRLEIATALEMHKPIYPVLIGRMDMPAARDLPEDIRGFAALQAVFAREPAFDAAMAVLARTLETRHGWVASPDAAGPRAGTRGTSRAGTWAAAAFAALALAWITGRLIAWMSTGSGRVGPEAATWNGTLYLLTTLLWGMGPYLVQRGVAEVRARAHLPVRNLLGVLTTVNLAATMLAGGTFLLLSTRKAWALELPFLFSDPPRPWQYALQGGILVAIVAAAVGVALLEPWVRSWSSSPRRVGSAGLLGAAAGVTVANAWFAWALLSSVPPVQGDAVVPVIGYFMLAGALTFLVMAWDEARWRLAFSSQSWHGRLLLALVISLYLACTLGYFAHGPVHLFRATA